MTAVDTGSATQPWHISAFYQFQTVPDPVALVVEVTAFMKGVQADDKALRSDRPLLGTVLVAREGINGTIAGSSESVTRVFEWLAAQGFGRLMRRNTRGDSAPFHRLKVRVKKEIVTMGRPDIDASAAGDYVDPSQWDRLISDPAVTLVDTRNHYETCLGSFSGALVPQTDSFRDFPAWAEKNLDPKTQPKVAMFCTGGIRCEKATALLKAQGFEQVYHLQGGILNYLQQVPEPDSSWQGECFVFDDRVTVDHQLQPGNHQQCFNCRMPLTEEDLAGPHYEQHVSCHHCYRRVDEDRRAGLLERARQMRLAKERGQAHLGAEMPAGDGS